MGLVATSPMLQQEQVRTVTASELVRHFGQWQSHANESPVYVLHHGRPRWVLLSAELMKAVAPEDDGTARGAAEIDIVLDHMRTIMVLVDSDLNVRRFNRAARAHFATSEGAVAGQPLTMLVPHQRGRLIEEAARRVRDSGREEMLEIESSLYPGRRFDVEITPFPGGVALFASDVTEYEELRALRSELLTYEALFAAKGDVAHGRITPRGMVTGISPSLAAMTGLEAAALDGVRLTSLLDVPDRPEINAVIDRLFETGSAQTAHARLLARNGDPLAVAINFAPVHDGLSTPGARFLIARSA